MKLACGAARLHVLLRFLAETVGIVFSEAIKAIAGSPRNFDDSENCRVSGQPLVDFSDTIRRLASVRSKHYAVSSMSRHLSIGFLTVTKGAGLCRLDVASLVAIGVTPSQRGPCAHRFGLS
jgi:hypothetical protein